MKLALSRRLATASTVALTAVAVAFAGTPANAADTTSFSTSGERVTGSAVSVKVQAYHARLTRSSTIQTRVVIRSTARLTGATADVFVGGRFRQKVTLAYQDGPVSFSRRAGFGTAQLRNVRVTYVNADGTPGSVVAASNTFQIRRAIDTGARLAMRKSGSKIRVTGTRWRAGQPNGTWIRVPQVIVQRKVGRTWRNVKVVRPNTRGGFSFTFRSSKKVYYRAIVKTTPTLAGGATRSFRI